MRLDSPRIGTLITENVFLNWTAIRGKENVMEMETFESRGALCPLSRIDDVIDHFTFRNVLDNQMLQQQLQRSRLFKYERRSLDPARKNLSEYPARITYVGWCPLYTAKVCVHDILFQVVISKQFHNQTLSEKVCLLIVRQGALFESIILNCPESEPWVTQFMTILSNVLYRRAVSLFFTWTKL